MRPLSPLSLVSGLDLDGLDELFCASSDPLSGPPSSSAPSGVVESSTSSSSSMSMQEAKRERQRAKERDKARRAYKRKMVRLFKGDARETGVCLV
jgi:hypothetical protein